MICKKENENTIINRVWIVKRSISLGDRQVGFVFVAVTITSMLLNKHKKNYINKVPKPFFKHWAIILELNNGSYVNFQSGRNGFSLKEFIKTNIEGENILNSILETWGEKTHPFSFCYLGNANYEYENLKKYLKGIKDKETKKFEEEGKAYYNLIHHNCQHFACEIEKILFGKIKFWHSFDYYLD